MVLDPLCTMASYMFGPSLLHPSTIELEPEPSSKKTKNTFSRSHPVGLMLIAHQAGRRKIDAVWTQSFSYSIMILVSICNVLF